MENAKGVYKKICAVQGEICKVGIGKDRKNEKQNYAFRGIDDVYNALAPLLSKNGLCILPRVLSRTVTKEPSKTGGMLFYVVLDMEFDFVDADDGSMHTAKVSGEAMDTGDKATNKAMSAAYKYVCLQTFCIPTEGDNDADAKTHEVSTKVSQKPLSATDIALIAKCQTIDELNKINVELKKLGAAFDTSRLECCKEQAAIIRGNDADKKS